ncbi:MAG: phage tail protein [Sodalis sp. (in: enterobacteria)]|uniref:phage tail protein n=1 Tax=Sodalis sp. (in: enterobacteria) TaxID=1898979 RepID=UPI003F378316
MALEYTGAVVLEVNSTEVEVTEFSPRANTGGKQLVKTMNSTGRAKAYSQGIATWELSITAVVPVNNTLHWEKISGAKLTQYPLQRRQAHHLSGCVCHRGGRTVYR